jgi:hypothetical protein
MKHSKLATARNAYRANPNPLTAQAWNTAASRPQNKRHAYEGEWSDSVDAVWKETAIRRALFLGAIGIPDGTPMAQDLWKDFENFRDQYAIELHKTGSTWEDADRITHAEGFEAWSAERMPAALA